MAQHIHSGTTVANIVAKTTFPSWSSTIEIINTGVSDIWARVDATDPVIAADECVYIPSGTWIQLTNRLPAPDPLGTNPGTDIRLISTVATSYTVSAGV
jgi:hypothetical protein